MDGIELLVGVGMADVEDVQKQIGVDGLFEGGAEAGDEVVRQIADEAYGVAEEDFYAAVYFPVSGFGVEGGEEFIVGVGAGGGEGVEERAFAGVGVADDADGEVTGGALGDFAGFAALDAGDFLFEAVDAFADEAAVDFELLFAGAACADAGGRAAGDAFEVAPHLRKARIGVLHLGQFDLQLGFLGAGAGGEDVEDEFGAVEDLDAFEARGVGVFVDGSFEGADLAGVEIVVEDDDVGLGLDGGVGDFDDLAAADVSSGIDAAAFLEDGADDFCTGGLGKGGEFAEGIARIGGGVGEEDADEDGAFLSDRQGGAL